jgi:hypothetical protein
MRCMVMVLSGNAKKGSSVKDLILRILAKVYKILRGLTLRLFGEKNNFKLEIVNIHLQDVLVI